VVVIWPRLVTYRQFLVKDVCCFLLIYRLICRRACAIWRWGHFCVRKKSIYTENFSAQKMLKKVRNYALDKAEKRLII